MKKLHERIKELRTEKELSMEELGKLIGVSKAAIGNYESGLRVPRPEQLEALADVFNVDMDYLFGRTDRKLKISFESNRVLYLMKKLNSAGKKEAVKRVSELTMIPKYSSDNLSSELNAAHTRIDIEITQSMLNHDDAIMDDEDF